MPWYWTDDLARTLIDAGKVDQARVAAWIASPVAIRRQGTTPAEVAVALLDEEGEAPSPPVALAA